MVNTYSGTFHADEALAVSMLRLLPAYAHSSLLRSRDPSRLSSCDVVVDVGGEYEPARHRYDHHQRSFDTSFPHRSTKLSSAGLVWLHFGKAIVGQRCGKAEDDGEVQMLWEKLYLEFVEAIDANDNGISVYDRAQLAAAGIEKRFSDGNTTISALISDLNRGWNESSDDEAGSAQESEEDARFQEASRLIGDAFQRKLHYYVRSWLPARSLVQTAYAERKRFDDGGRIMVLRRSLPWKNHLYGLESEERDRSWHDERSSAVTVTQVLYVLYPESSSPEARWRIQAVPLTSESFHSRKPLPKAWRGVRDDVLTQVCGVSGAIFVHANGFIGGNDSFDGALDMARKAIED